MSEAQMRGGQMATVRRMTPAEVWPLVQTGKAVLVDTRGRAQYDEMHVDHAIDVPLAEIQTSPTVPELQSIPADKLIVFYCT